jgi:DNA repair protein RecO (recombination protein O)
MQWRDEGIVIGLRRHGETSVVVEAMTRRHGRHMGLVRGGRAARLSGVLQPGNTLDLIWRARLDEHLGAFQAEALRMRAGRFLPHALALTGLSYLGALMRLLPERDPHEALYEALSATLETLDDGALAPAMMARFEAALLGESGYALDLSKCALTGVTEGLAYVSPRSGRAVSAAAAAPWLEKLLPLPPFLAGDLGRGMPDAQDLAAAFHLTGHFLRRDLFLPRGQDLPDARRAFLVAAGITAISPLSLRD